VLRYSQSDTLCSYSQLNYVVSQFDYVVSQSGYVAEKSEQLTTFAILFFLIN